MTKKRKGKSTSASRHKKRGTKLVPPLKELPAHLVQYDRDLLPEHLWIAALVDEHGIDLAHRPYYDLLDAIDSVWTEKELALGLISDFGCVPSEARAEFKEKYKPLIRSAFHDRIGRILAFFPDGPAYWLVDQDALEDVGSLDPDIEVTRLRYLVEKLFAAKDDFAGHCRMMPLGRILKHGRIAVPRDFALMDVLPRYPGNCTDEERRSVQSFGRITVNMNYERASIYADRAWPKYFWRHNFDLAPCATAELPPSGMPPLGEPELRRVADALAFNAERMDSYLREVAVGVRSDLYSPERDEVIFGLFARCCRLYVLMCSESVLWTRDTGGLMLRCLAETVINLSYLLRVGTDDDFSRFREYGEGQEKLLMLHLQDLYSSEASLEGRTADDIREDLGNFNAELLDIELGSWSKQDTRKLAHKAGLERLYHLVFTPTSADVHGTWLSLKHTNLFHCVEPLHRFHRLPLLPDPKVYINTIIAAQQLIETAVAIGVELARFPPCEPPLSPAVAELASELKRATAN
jgi:hypothetical protein